MARIRSIHPGLFTDEAFAQCSMEARLLIIGIWTECWDDGVFEWKPLRLKMRLFAADNIDVAPLLKELVRAGMISQFSTGGRLYGAVRNFRRFQSPKKPNASKVLPPEMLEYVGLSDGKPKGAAIKADAVESAPLDNTAPNQSHTDPMGERPPNKEADSDTEFSTSTEISPLKGGREEGRKGGRESYCSSLRSEQQPPESSKNENHDFREFDRDRETLNRLQAALRCAAGLENDPSPDLFDLSAILAFLDKNVSLEQTILPTLRVVKAKKRKGKTWNYYVPAINDAIKNRSNSAVIAEIKRPIVDSPDDPLITFPGDKRIPTSFVRRDLEAWAQDRRKNPWNEGLYGTSPDRPGCYVPDELFEEFGLSRAPYPQDDFEEFGLSENAA